MTNSTTKTSSLPAHLQKSINAYENKAKAFGLNPNFFAECAEKAEKANDDDALVWGLV